MKLYMKQKVFSFRDRFTIKDETGNDRYHVEGQLISLGKKLHIYDMDRNEVAFVREKLISLTPAFIVEIDGQSVAKIVKKITLLKPKYYVEGPDWEVSGRLLEHDYRIMDDGNAIISIHKKWMSWGDSYEIDISDSEDEVLALAVVLAIDAVMTERD